MLIFRVLLVGIMLSTSAGVIYAVSSRAEFVGAFPGASHLFLYVAFLVVAATGLVALAGLWFWRRWAVVVYAVATVASLVLDVAAHAPALHQLAVVLGAAAVFSLIAANRARFRSATGFETSGGDASQN